MWEHIFLNLYRASRCGEADANGPSSAPSRDGAEHRQGQTTFTVCVTVTYELQELGSMAGNGMHIRAIAVGLVVVLTAAWCV